MISALLVGGPPGLGDCPPIRRVPCDLVGFLSVSDYTHPDILIYWPDKTVFAPPASLQEWKIHWRPEYDRLFAKRGAYDIQPPDASASKKAKRAYVAAREKQRRRQTYTELIPQEYWRALRQKDRDWFESDKAEAMDFNIKRVCFRRLSERVKAARRGAITIVVVPGFYQQSGSWVVGGDDDAFSWLLYGCRMMPNRHRLKIILPSAAPPINKHACFEMLVSLTQVVKSWPFSFNLPGNISGATRWRDIEVLFSIQNDLAGKKYFNEPVSVHLGHLLRDGNPVSLFMAIGAGGFVIIPEPKSLDDMLVRLGVRAKDKFAQSVLEHKEPGGALSLVPDGLAFKPWGKKSGSLRKLEQSLRDARSINDLLRVHPYKSVETLTRTLRRFQASEPRLKRFVQWALGRIRKLATSKS